MSLKTTYLLGAGASALALPVVADLANAVDQVFAEILEHVPIEQFQGTFWVTERGAKKVDEEDLKKRWGNLDYIRSAVFEDLSTNLSIDTVAKLKYTFDKHTEYHQLKAVLIASFMLWEQRNGLDKRYNNFWATLANTKKPLHTTDYTFRGFRGNINIVSWNYDSQLERSLDLILDDSKWEVHSKLAHKIFVQRDHGINPIIYKLNGSARINDVAFDLRPDEIRTSDSRFRMGLAGIILYPERFDSLSNLCYSWEEGTRGTSDIELAQIKCSDTHTLVVIGYSFPTLNSVVDHAIVGNMTSLKKVYFQGKNKEDSIQIMEHFLSLNGEKQGVSYKPIESAGFYVPTEVTIVQPPNNAVF